MEFAATDLGKRNRSDANRKTLLLGAGLIIIWVVPAGAFGGFVTALVMLIAVGSMLAMLHFTKLRSSRGPPAPRGPRPPIPSRWVRTRGCEHPHRWSMAHDRR